jgi:hypothetical protein
LYEGTGVRNQSIRNREESTTKKRELNGSLSKYLRQNLSER